MLSFPDLRYLTLSLPDRKPVLPPLSVSAVLSLEKQKIYGDSTLSVKAPDMPVALSPQRRTVYLPQ